MDAAEVGASADGIAEAIGGGAVEDVVLEVEGVERGAARHGAGEGRGAGVADGVVAEVQMGECGTGW